MGEKLEKLLSLLDSLGIWTSEQLFTATYNQAGTVSLNLIACSSTGQCVEANHTTEIVEHKE